jgi:membrane AbrB-like protein
MIDPAGGLPPEGEQPGTGLPPPQPSATPAGSANAQGASAGLGERRTSPRSSDADVGPGGRADERRGVDAASGDAGPGSRTDEGRGVDAASGDAGRCEDRRAGLSDTDAGRASGWLAAMGAAGFWRHPLRWPFAAALVVGVAAALLCVWLNTPLPWIIGPLFGTAALRLAGVHLHSPVPVREAGQWAIGTVLGLYFTAPVLAVLASRAGYIALAVAFALGLGWLCGLLLQKLTGTDRATAFFSMAMGGASEMAVQGERHGGDVQRVAAAHSLRVMMVVATIPFAVRYWSTHGMAAFPEPVAASAAAVSGGNAAAGALATVGTAGAAATSGVHLGGLLALIALTSIVALLFKKKGVPNAWVIGPLLATATLTACGIHLSSVPEWMVRAGQLSIGISLGTRFSPEFLRAAPRYIASVAICNVVALSLAAGFAGLIAWAAGIHGGTAVLATSPGGIAEMALTARTLHLGVPIVTAFHVCRMAVLVLTIGPIFRRTQQRI